MTPLDRTPQPAHARASFVAWALAHIDTLAVLLAPLLRHFPARARTLVFSVAASLGLVAADDDWGHAAIIVTIYLVGGLIDAVLSWRLRRLTRAADSIGAPRDVRIPPDIVLLVALSAGLSGCAGWRANLATVTAEASAVGALTWEEGSGLSTTGELACEAAAAGEICYRARCVPLEVTVTADAAGQQARVCAHVGPFTRCEVVP